MELLSIKYTGVTITTRRYTETLKHDSHDDKTLFSPFFPILPVRPSGPNELKPGYNPDSTRLVPGYCTCNYVGRLMACLERYVSPTVRCPA